MEVPRIRLNWPRIFYFDFEKRYLISFYTHLAQLAVFRFFWRRSGSFAATEQQAVLVLHDPLDGLAAGELHGLGNGRGEV